MDGNQRVRITSPRGSVRIHESYIRDSMHDSYVLIRTLWLGIRHRSERHRLANDFHPLINSLSINSCRNIAVNHQAHNFIPIDFSTSITSIFLVYQSSRALTNHRSTISSPWPNLPNPPTLLRLQPQTPWLFSKFQRKHPSSFRLSMRQSRWKARNICSLRKRNLLPSFFWALISVTGNMRTSITRTPLDLWISLSGK